MADDRAIASRQNTGMVTNQGPRLEVGALVGVRRNEEFSAGGKRAVVHQDSRQGSDHEDVRLPRQVAGHVTAGGLDGAFVVVADAGREPAVESDCPVS